ncbi:MAG: hypothetical protein B7Z72_03615, partial [Gemmatimonadetes bacterium 21-71-4]
MKRRHFVATSAGALGALAIGCKPSAGVAAATGGDDATPPLPASIQALQPLTPAPAPITNEE